MFYPLSRISVNHFSKVALIGMALALGACSVLEPGKVDYRSAAAAKPTTLNVPPDLTQLSRDNRYVVIDGAVSASTVQSAQAPSNKVTVAALAMGDVRIERSGNQRWLVVKRPADRLWEPVKEFWLENGFQLVKDQSDLGIMETDWAENRAKIPSDIIRNTIGRVLDFLYSTSERDKFRTRLERNAQGETEIFISHRGVEEVYTSGSKDKSATASSPEQTIWQPRPVDPELEAEFLRKLMVKLGVGSDKAPAMVATNDTVKSTSAVTTEKGQTVVRISEGFDRAWRRVGLALDRTGFTVEDRDRKQGVYFVRYVASPTENTEPGFFSKLFSSSDKTNAALKFRIVVKSEAEVTTVSVQNEQGLPETSATAQRIVKVIADDLK
jgi:outer membrane protein assembly factor BamC